MVNKFTITTFLIHLMTTPYNICDCELNGDGYSDNFKYEYYKVWKQELKICLVKML